MLKPGRLAFAIAALLVGVVATMALGNWQLRRAAEHDAADAAWRAALGEQALRIRGTSEIAAAAARLPRHVRVSGTFDFAHTVWLDNRALAGRAGFLAVTPLRLPEVAEQILVIRGWAPRDPVDRTRLPNTGGPDGRVEIEGVAIARVPRLFEFASWAAADRGGAIRQNLEIDEMRDELGTPLAPFVVQQTSSAPDSLQRQIVAPPSGAERNRAYALQWFSMATLCAAALAGVSWKAISRYRQMRKSA